MNKWLPGVKAKNKTTNKQDFFDIPTGFFVAIGHIPNTDILKLYYS
jgi:thioredoxin reductase